MTPNPRNRALAELGQSIWVDNITRGMLDDGTLAGYIAEYSVTGLTSNPTIFDKAISSGEDYTDQIVSLAERGEDSEAIFFDLALDDLGRAADLFLPTHEQTGGVDGWVSLEVSPLLADDGPRFVDATAALGMDECLTPGYAICSPSPHGGWAFGIDPVDGRIKLWEGERVSSIKSI